MSVKNKSYGRKIKLKTVLLIVALIFIVVVFAYLLGADNSYSSQQMVVIEPVSQSMLYPESEKILLKGTNVSITNNGIMFEMDGKTVLVTPDGVVYLVNEDGTLTRADSETARKALIKAFEFASENAEIKDLLHNVGDIDGNPNFSEKMILSGLTDAELRQIAEALGLDPDSFVEMVRNKENRGEIVSLESVLEEQRELEKKKKQAEAATKDELGQILDIIGEKDISAEDFYNAVQNSDRYRDDPEQLSKDIVQYGTDYVLEQLGLKPGTTNTAGSDSDVAVADSAQRYRNSEEIGYTIEDYLSGRIDSLEGLVNPQSDYDKQNNQGGKTSFVSSQQTGTKVVSRTLRDDMLTTGTIINATLMTDINTDLPGQAVALVNQNVYDTFTMNNVLIPKGARVIGTYDSSVSYGQTRVLIAWNKIIFDNGTILNINGYGSVDNGGAGLTGDVNNQILSIAGGTALSTLLAYANGQLSEISTSEAVQALISNSASSVVKVEVKLLNKLIDRQPTITIVKGTSFSILVNDDVSLPIYK